MAAPGASLLLLSASPGGHKQAGRAQHARGQLGRGGRRAAAACELLASDPAVRWMRSDERWCGRARSDARRTASELAVWRRRTRACLEPRAPDRPARRASVRCVSVCAAVAGACRPLAAVRSRACLTGGSTGRGRRDAVALARLSSVRSLVSGRAEERRTRPWQRQRQRRAARRGAARRARRTGAVGLGTPPRHPHSLATRLRAALRPAARCRAPIGHGSCRNMQHTASRAKRQRAAMPQDSRRKESRVEQREEGRSAGIALRTECSRHSHQRSPTLLLTLPSLERRRQQQHQQPGDARSRSLTLTGRLFERSGACSNSRSRNGHTPGQGAVRAVDGMRE